MACKICRLKEEYGTSINLQSEYNEESLRQLSHRFNQELLKMAAHEAGVSYPGNVFESHYYNLRGKNSETARQDSIDVLRRDGVEIDVFIKSGDRYAGDFVSYVTMRDHLCECLGVDTSSEGSTLTAEKAAQQAQNRTNKVRKTLEDTLTRLQNQNIVDSEFRRIDVDITVTCDCGRRLSFGELIDQEGCPRCKHG